MAAASSFFSVSFSACENLSFGGQGSSWTNVFDEIREQLCSQTCVAAAGNLGVQFCSQTCVAAAGNLGVKFRSPTFVAVAVNLTVRLVEAD